MGRYAHHHQLEHRIEAHIFIAFLAYCLHVLRVRLKPLAPGLTPTAVLDKFAGIQMLELWTASTAMNVGPPHVAERPSAIRLNWASYQSSITQCRKNKKGTLWHILAKRTQFL